MGKLLLVKHSMPAIDVTVPAREWTLSQAGIDLCRGLGSALADYQPAALFSSDEPKARETAERVGTCVDLPVTVRADLGENDRTGFEYIADPEEFRARFRAFFANRDTRLIGNESANEASLRFATALRPIVSDTAVDTTVVVTHGTVLTLFVERHNDIDAFDFWDALSLPSFAVLDLPSCSLVDVRQQFAI